MSAWAWSQPVEGSRSPEGEGTHTRQRTRSRRRRRDMPRSSRMEALRSGISVDSTPVMRPDSTVATIRKRFADPAQKRNLSVVVTLRPLQNVMSSFFGPGPGTTVQSTASLCTSRGTRNRARNSSKPTQLQRAMFTPSSGNPRANDRAVGGAVETDIVGAIELGFGRRRGRTPAACLRLTASPPSSVSAWQMRAGPRCEREEIQRRWPEDGLVSRAAGLRMVAR